MHNWPAYYRRVGQVPNPFVTDLLEFYQGPRIKAFDLGAGNMRDSKYLLEQGFEVVVAVDENPASRSYLVPGIELRLEAIEKWVPVPGSFDLGISVNTFFFLTFVGMKIVLERAYTGLRPGGVFACNILGRQSSWVLDGEKGIDYLRPENVDELRTLYNPVAFDPVEWDADDSNGTPEHWHCWNILIRKH